MRTAIFLTASAIIFTAATPVSAAEGEQRFEHQGYTYVYRTADDHGRKVITGHRLPGNAPFRLVVKGDRVTGTTGNSNVAFRTSDARGAAGGIAATGR